MPWASSLGKTATYALQRLIPSSDACAPGVPDRWGTASSHPLPAAARRRLGRRARRRLGRRADMSPLHFQGGCSPGRGPRAADGRGRLGDSRREHAGALSVCRWVASHASESPSRCSTVPRTMSKRVFPPPNGIQQAVDRSLPLWSRAASLSLSLSLSLALSLLFFLCLSLILSLSLYLSLSLVPSFYLLFSLSRSENSLHERGDLVTAQAHRHWGQGQVGEHLPRHSRGGSIYPATVEAAVPTPPQSRRQHLPRHSRGGCIYCSQAYLPVPFEGPAGPSPRLRHSRGVTSL